MPADSDRTHATSSRQAVRIQYLGSRSQDDYREYHFAVHVPEGSRDVRLRIPVAAFGAARVLLQDGPDVCYQHLVRLLAAGEAASRDVITLDGSELTAHREAHTPPPRRSAPPPTSSKPVRPPRPPLQEKPPRLPVAAAAPPAAAEPAFDEGQRVTHEVFGAGVTMASSEGRTTVQFDDHGVKTFVTSLLKLERLSGPHEWEAGPRGKNRPRDVDR